MKYTIDYFINKFEAIPDDKWTTHTYVNDSGARCALGHCGRKDDDSATAASNALGQLLWPIMIHKINDDEVEEYPQPTPKARILAALRDKKEGKI